MKITEYSLVVAFESIQKQLVNTLEEMKKEPIHPKYFDRMYELISSDFDVVKNWIPLVDKFSNETLVKITLSFLETYNCFLKVRAISSSKWLDKHGNFLDKLIGVRAIKLPDINFPLK